MSKILIIVGVIMMGLGISRIANAEEALTLIAKKDIEIQANTNRTLIAVDEELECSLEHNSVDVKRFIKKDSQLYVQSVEQSEYKPLLKDEAESIITELGGTYDASKIKTDVDAINEIEALGGAVNVINGKLITAYKQQIVFMVASSKTKNAYELTCLARNDLTVQETVKRIEQQGNLAQLVEIEL